jgi:hypothetical protein
MVVLGLVAAGISRLLASSWESELTITDQNEAQKWAQRAADTVIDSLRGSSGVMTGDATSVKAGFSAGGSTTHSLTYYLTNGELRRVRRNEVTGQADPSEVVCRNVSGLAFSYYLRSGNTWGPAASPSLAQSLRVSVTVGSGKGQATETSLVQFRNKI